MKRILLIDNYDSFTHNLVHYIEELDFVVDVFRNDEVVECFDLYQGVVLSPGPGLPGESGEMFNVIRAVCGRIPVLGVCLGMQAIAEHLGGQLYNLNNVKHGVSEQIDLNDSVLFTGMPNKIKVGLYHSWAVKDIGDFEVTSISDNQVVMSIENKRKMMFGVQFHPESVLTPDGKKMIQNFMSQL